MIREEIQIINKHGLHARPAAQFVKIAGRFQSEIKVIKDGLEVNGKSIMGIMMLAAEPGSTIIVVADGADEAAALQALKELITNKFYEEAI
jgi:phosphocarrier protein HPr